MENYQNASQENAEIEENGKERNYFSDDQRRMMNKMEVEDLRRAYDVWSIGIEGIDEEDVASAREEIRNVILNKLNRVPDMATYRSSPKKRKTEKLKPGNVAEVIEFPIKAKPESRPAQAVKRPSRPNLRLIK